MSPSPPLTAARGGLGAFLVSGLLLAFLGAILPAWRYHIEPNFVLIGSYFLCQNLGLLVGGQFARGYLRKRGIGRGLVLGCALAAAGLLTLGFFSPPAHFLWRLGGLFLTGLAAGFVHSGAFHAIVPAYDHEPASTLSLAGVLFNVGALVAVLVVASTFFDITITWILVILALAPAIAAWLYSRSEKWVAVEVSEPSWQETLRDFRTPAAVLFSLLLFFQFGNEGAVAGWLSLYLIQRLGLSPVTSLLGRVAGLGLMRRVRPGRLLAGSVLTQMFGCLILASTDNLFGAITAVILLSGGFAFILPLVMVQIAGRFPYFHPGFFSGIFSLAMTGGVLAPASVG